MTSTAQQINLSDAAERLSKAQTRVQERRRFRRMPIAVAGRMLDTLGREHDCRTADISPGDVRIIAPVLPDVGERVVLYLEGFGRVSGAVVRRGDDGAAVVFDFSAHKREKLAEQLTLAINKDLEIGADPAKPIIGKTPSYARIELDDGQSFQGEILDFSLTGVTVRATRPPPMIGSWVRVGQIYGRVARLIENGFAIDFEPRPRNEAI